MTIHPSDCECETSYGCQLRRKSVGYAMVATPTARARRPWRDGSKVNHNSWEAGVAGERRRDGSFIPYVGDKTGRRIHVKEYGERRHELTQARKRQIVEGT